MVAQQLVVAQGRVGVLHHVLLGPGLGLLLGLGHIGPQGQLGVGRRPVTGLGAEPHVRLGRLVGLLQRGGGDDQRVHVVVGDHGHRLGGAAGAPQVVGEVTFELGAQAETFDLVVLTGVVALPGGQELLEHLEALVEAGPRFALVDAEPGELPPAQPPADTEDDPAVAAKEGVEHIDVLGHPHRVVPGEHHHHRAQVDVLGDPQPCR